MAPYSRPYDWKLRSEYNSSIVCHSNRVISCLAFLDADRIGVPSRPLHTEADDIRPFLAVRVHLVHRELLEHLTLCLQLVQLPLVLLGGHLTMKPTPRGCWSG